MTRMAEQWQFTHKTGELVAEDLQYELEAYRDFCEFRASQPPKAGVKSRRSDVTREEWLASRRKELQSRMHRRRKRLFGST